MGTWGPGLYANDLARDLKPTISSVIRLPFSPSELIRLLEESFPRAGGKDEVDEDFTTFWLVVADQFHKQGIDEPSVFARAIEIIDSGSDLNCPERLEFSSADRRQREKALRALRERLATPPPNKTRKTLSKPQPLLMQTGDLVVYPLFAHRNCINPYLSRWTHPQEGWGVACIVRSGHVFEYLACYHPVVLVSPFELTPKPGPADLHLAGPWELQRPGTCSKLHFQRMQLEIIDSLTLDPNRIAERFPQMRNGRYQAVNDISLSNSLGPCRGEGAFVESLGEIAPGAMLS